MRNFGEQIESVNYRVLNERQLRASAGIMFLLGLTAFINGFILSNYIAISYVSGFLLFNFMIGIFINPKYSPTMLVGQVFVRKQTPIYIGAVQKKFAWSLGMILAGVIFSLSLMLLNDTSFFGPVCMLCLVCLSLIYIELAFGICLGCKLYDLALFLKLMKMPEQKPNCIGDACSTDNN